MERVASNKGQSIDLVTTIRAVLLTTLTTAILFPKFYQPALDLLWHSLQKSTVYNWSTFETLWTVFCYAAIEVPITATFISHPEWRLAHRNKSSGGSQDESERKKPRGMRRPSRRGWEALVYVLPLLTMDLTLIKKFAGVPLEDMLVSGNYPLDHFEGNTTAATTPGLTAQHTTFLAPTLHNFTLSSPLQTRRALPPSAPSSRRLVLELVTALVLYDALFFAFHLSLHILPGLKRWHNPHHAHAEMHPQLTNQLTIFERLGLVLLANFSLNIIGSHVLTRTAFVPVFVWLLVEIHCGMEVPWGYEKVLPKGWGGGAKKHARHHEGGGGGYEPYFCWWDGTWEWVCGFVGAGLEGRG